MDGFTYYNIFQTKGIEYIIIIIFLLSLVPFWIFVNKGTNFATKIQTSLGVITAAILKAPKGIFYSKNHTWAHLEKSGLAEIGIDDWLLHLTGNANFRYLKNIGDMVKKGDLMLEIESNGKKLHVSSPISGKIINGNITHSSLELVKNDLYTNGWLYKVEPVNWKAETNDFYIGNEVKNWIKDELARFKDFLAISLGENSPLTSMVILQEGGELRDHTLSELSETIWNDFQKEFLER